MLIQSWTLHLAQASNLDRWWRPLRNFCFLLCTTQYDRRLQGFDALNPPSRTGCETYLCTVIEDRVNCYYLLPEAIAAGRVVRAVNVLDRRFVMAGTK